MKKLLKMVHVWKQVVWIFLLLYKGMDVECAKELRLLGMLSETGVSYKSAGACLPAIEMALEDIRHREDILKDYNLTYTWVDSRCHAGTALFRMFERLKDDPPYQLILGPPCSIATEATAQVSYMWNLTQLSCEAASPILSDRTRFPQFFRTFTPDQKLNIARIALLKEFNWQRIATVHQAREYFSTITDDLVQRIVGTNISIVAQEIFVNDPDVKVKNLKRHDARIILTSMYEDKARELLCAAYKVGLYGPKIVWIFTGWYAPKFWENDIENTQCTSQEMALVVEGSFFTGAMYKNPVEERGIANLTVREFETRYFNHSSYKPEWRDTVDVCAALCYDHIWTAALALKCATQVLKETGHSKTLDEFIYSDADIGKIIFECMGNVSMIGVSGTTTFTEGSDSEKLAQIDRIQDGNRERVGLYRQDKHPSYFEWVDGALRWKNGKIPTDSAQIKEEEIHFPVALHIVMASLGALGICLSISFFVVNVIHRNNRYVKLSSPNMNNILLFGCVLCYMSVFFKTTGSQNAALCRTRIYFFSLGFTVTFGSLFSKTWRVYRIFINKKLHKVQIKDSQLILVTGLLVALILVLLVIWDIIGPQMIKSKFLPKEVYVTSDGTEIRPFVRVCWSEYSSYFTWTICIIQGALLTFGTFLAWETRKVRVKGLNDSQRIGISIYNVVVLSAVGVVLTFLLDDQEVLLYGISSGFLIFGTTVTQLLIFIPKIRAVVNKVEVTITSRDNNSVRSAQPSSSTDIYKIDTGSTQPPNNNCPP